MTESQQAGLDRVGRRPMGDAHHVNRMLVKRGDELKGPGIEKRKGMGADSGRP